MKYYENIGEYNPNKKFKIFIVFDDMIADMISNKSINGIVTELFIRAIKLNFALFLLRNVIFIMISTNLI